MTDMLSQRELDALLAGTTQSEDSASSQYLTDYNVNEIDVADISNLLIQLIKRQALSIANSDISNYELFNQQLDMLTKLKQLWFEIIKLETIAKNIYDAQVSGV